MTSSVIQKFAKEHKIPSAKVERYWEKAKSIAKKKFKTTDPQFYPYVTGILKKMLSVTSSINNREYFCITAAKKRGNSIVLYFK